MKKRTLLIFLGFLIVFSNDSNCHNILKTKALFNSDLTEQLVKKISEINIYYLSSSDIDIVGNTLKERKFRRNKKVKKLFQEFKDNLYKRYKNFTTYKQETFSCEGKYGKAVSCAKYMRVKKGDYEFFHGSIEIIDNKDGGLKAGPDLYAHSLHEITLMLGKAGEGTNTVTIKAGVKYSESKIQKLIHSDINNVRKRLKELNLPDDKES